MSHTRSNRFPAAAEHAPREPQARPGQRRAEEAADDLPRGEAFVPLFVANRDRLHAYLITLLRSPHDAEEVFQQISLTLWRRFDQFRPGTDFMAWAKAVAVNEVRNFRRKRAADRHVFSDQTLELLIRDERELVADLDSRWHAMSRCLEGLGERDRALIDRFYGSGDTAHGLAEVTGRSVVAIRKAIRRIRRALFECVETRVAAMRGEDRP